MIWCTRSAPMIESNPRWRPSIGTTRRSGATVRQRCWVPRPLRRVGRVQHDRNRRGFRNVVECGKGHFPTSGRFGLRERLTGELQESTTQARQVPLGTTPQCRHQLLDHRSDRVPTEQRLVLPPSVRPVVAVLAREHGVDQCNGTYFDPSGGESLTEVVGRDSTDRPSRHCDPRATESLEFVDDRIDRGGSSASTVGYVVAPSEMITTARTVTSSSNASASIR